MRGITVAAVLTSTLLAISGCATTNGQPAAPATAVPAVTVSGLDEATANACAVSNHATLGEENYDFDVATAQQIVALGKTSKSTMITAAANLLDLPARQAAAAVGEPEEAAHLAELRSAMLKFQTVCQDVDALVGSIQESRQAVDEDADDVSER